MRYEGTRNPSSNGIRIGKIKPPPIKKVSEGEEEMKITNETIPLIEKALGFTLYNWQRAYLLDEPHTIPTERATGRTTAYIVKLLLTNREPINIKFEAMKYKDHQGVQYTHFFRNFMREIDEKLTTVGLPTCSVKPQREHKQVLATMGIDLDTKRFELKLRAIAKHCEELANELDAIDNEHDNDLPTRLEGSD